MGPEEGGGLRPIEPVSETQKRKRNNVFFPRAQGCSGGWEPTCRAQKGLEGLVTGVTKCPGFLRTAQL